MTTVPDEIRGHVVVVMGPTGSGKGTVIKRALEEHPTVYQTVSCTSRVIRPGETDGIQYHFLTIEEFDKKIEAGEFLEWAEFAGHKYGTLKSEIIPRLADCQMVLVEIEVQGVEQLLELLPRDHMTIVYIEAGGWDVLGARAKARAPITEAELEARRQRFLVEKQAKPLADVIINNSEDIEIAHTEFQQVVEASYQKCKV